MKGAEATKNFIAPKAALARGIDPNKVYETHRTYSLDDRELRRLRPTATRLHWAFKNSTLEAADYLLQHGADIDLCNGGGLTVLHEVILDENEEAVAFLLENGANFDQRYPDGIHPLYMALIISNVPIFCHLVDAMSDFTTASTGRWTIVDLALLMGDHRALEILFEKDQALKPSPWTCSEFHDVPPKDIDPSKAQELLAVCTSQALIPLPDLYETYAYVLLSLAGTHYVESGTIMPTLLVDDVFQALYNAAGINTPASRVTPCQPCLSFQRFLGKPDDWSEIHQSRGDLDECAHSCPLCRLIADASYCAEEVAKKKAETTTKHDNEGCGRMCRICEARESKNANDHVSVQENTGGSSIHLKLREHVLYPVVPETHTFLVAQDGNTRAEVNLPIDAIDEAYIVNTNTPVGPDISTASQQSFDIANKWLDQCRRSSDHGDCQKTYTDTGHNLWPVLPTRILDLTSFPEPRLVETNGT
ncbi:uncharacterized protein FIESC28_01096 [Fusarium coffeatum]|uniref:Uncharacterized protein n=1 Tax=Fusarium coffeatum TaxID=231269 RepID=A0A366SAY2_9HYPO|nr:uncharacterized protein FIESC28_01096 [Fusarium coffeatum]RBR26068.1 hypothetical protein FIESC28_01096 [Fusarium coffeatum]